MHRTGKGEEANSSFGPGTEIALASGMLDEAVLYASVNGSFLVAMGRDTEALDAYLVAENLSDGDAHSRLRTARHLLSGMKQPVEALAKVNAVLESPAIDNLLVHLEARSIRGLALLALNQNDEVVAELRAACLEVSSANLASISLDLTLVEELSRKHLATDLCCHYLELVKSKALEEGERSILKKVREINSFLSHSKSNGL
ncbi:MAG: hypothetical protein HC838_16190 [Spirulinaceae cyanobacterium RM2_2_10]|nr:hypothetical protein [Spirulinaceae cyanobacterium RM2_2_10]